MAQPPHFVVFTDGACSGNPGPGGWGAVLLSPAGRVRELGGAEVRTTNNRMELKAVIEALRLAARDALPVRVYADSTYVISGVTTWVHAWRRRGWLTAEGKPVLNRDLWEELDALARAQGKSGLSWHYVRGHGESPGNNRADAIAVSFSKARPEALYDGPLLGYPHDILYMPPDQPIPRKGPSERRPKREGGWYVSLLDGRLEKHGTWADCQSRVHGRPAKFKKVFTPEEEAQVKRGWGV